MIEQLSIGLATARWISYLAVFIVVGASALRYLVVPRLESAVQERLAAFVRRITLHARLAALVLAITTLVKFYLQLRSLIDEGDPITGDLARTLAASPWGKGWLAQSIAIFGALVSWRWFGPREDGVAGRRTILTSALVLGATIPLTGHAIVPEIAGGWGYPAAALHVTMGAIWLGMLGNILAASPRIDRPTLVALLRGFSPIALVTGIITVLLGGLLAWKYLGGPSGLFGNDYGTTLLFKIGLAAAILGLGAFHWRIGLPGADAEGGISLRRTIIVEVVVAWVLLGVTAVLTGLATPLE